MMAKVKNRKNRNGLTKPKRAYEDIPFELPNTLTSARYGGSGVTATLPRYSQVVMKYNPVAYWSLNETSGLTVVDAVSAQNGTFVNNPTLGVLPGAVIGNQPAVTFKATLNQYITMGNLTALNFSSAFSASAWVKYTGTGNYGIVNKSNFSIDGKGWSMTAAANGFIRFWAVTAAAGTVIDTTLTTNAINDGAWHLVVVTWNGLTTANGAKVYIDGQLIKQVTAAAGTPSNTTDPIAIGGFPGSGTLNAFDGSIDEVALYAYALDAAAVLDLYMTGVRV